MATHSCFSIFSLLYIDKKHNETDLRPLKGLFPGCKFILSLFASGIITKTSDVSILRYLLQKN